MTRLRHFLKDDSGTSAIEFVFVFPMIFMIFTASFESSLFMSRYVMFERAVDEVVRQLRLRTLPNVTNQALKREICEAGMLISSVQDCINDMRIWMQPVNTANFVMAAPPRHCSDRNQPLNLVEEAALVQTGTDNDIMLMRICLKEDPMFATTFFSMGMASQPDGTYAMIVTSTFVNEPN